MKEIEDRKPGETSGNDDGFWNIDKLVPPSRRGAKRAPEYAEYKPGINTAEIIIGSPEKNENEVPIQSLKTCCPADNPGHNIIFKDSNILIDADICPYVSPTERERGFLRMARISYRKSSSPSAVHFPMYSFSPVYADMNSAQLNWYYSWRERFISGADIKTDNAYMNLFLSELVNLSLAGELSPADTILIIMRLWSCFRTESVYNDKLFCDIVSDFCILTRTPLPFEKIGEIICSIKTRGTPLIYGLYIFDYLLTHPLIHTKTSMDFMLSVISDYDYRSSKHYAENSEYAAKLSAVILKFTRSGIFSYDQSGDYLGTKKPSELTVKRRIFPGIVIDSSLVSSLSVRYYPLHCDESVRLRTASIVKYIENKLRAIYCIRNRLSNVNISSDQKSPIDAFFSRIHSVSNKPVEKLLSLDTEKQEVNKKVTVDINIEKAKNIELSSWDTTKKLTEAFDDSGEMLDFAIIPSIDSFDAEDECDTPQEDYECDSADEFATFASEITPLQKEILLFLLSDNKAAARTSAISAGSFLEAEVDLINSAAADIIRDIVIEQTLDITGDYISDLLRVLQS